MPTRSPSPLSLLFGLVLVLAAASASAQVPQDTTFTGRLVDDLGRPLPSPVDLELRVFDGETFGTQLYSVQHLGTALDANGAFSVQLGAGTSPSGTFDAGLFSSADRWLEIVVGNEVLIPRQIIASVPWALVSERASDADTVGGFAPAELLRAGHAEERASINDFASINFTSVVSSVATAPRDGFLMVWAHLNAEYDFNSVDGENVDLDCRIAVDGVPESIVIDQEFAQIPTGTNSGESLSVSTVVPVTSGMHDVDLECRTTASGLAFVKDRALTTLYVPFGDMGG